MDNDRDQLHQLSTKRKKAEAKAETKTKASRVDIRNLWPSRIIISASKTKSGEEYLFNKVGSVLSVSQDDVEFLLSLRRNRSCCGGVNEERRFFERLGV